MKILIALALFASTCQHPDPTGPGPIPPPDPVTDFPPDGGDDAGTPAPTPTGSPDQVALQLCLDNFQALNPDVPRAQLEELFCAGDQLLSWHRQALVKGKP